jgi:hypothetical protein
MKGMTVEDGDATCEFNSQTTLCLVSVEPMKKYLCVIAVCIQTIDVVVDSYLLYSTLARPWFRSASFHFEMVFSNYARDPDRK